MEPNRATARHAELRDLLGAFALGAVDADEATAMRAHLATCAECQAEMAQLWAAVDTLPAMIEPMTPPPALRQRIADAIEAEVVSRQSSVRRPDGQTTREKPVQHPTPDTRHPAPISIWSRAAPWAAAAAILLLLSAGLLIWNLRLQEQIAATVPETIALAPTDAAPGASGEVRYDPAAQLFLLDVRDLPPLEPDQVYEVWLIGGEGAPVPAGTFDQATDQHAIIADRGQFDTLAITAEPGPLGTAAPTGEIVATASL